MPLVSLSAVGCLQPCCCCCSLALGSAGIWASGTSKVQWYRLFWVLRQSCSLVWWQLLLIWWTSNPCHDSGCRISPVSFQLSWKVWQAYLLFHLFHMQSHAYQGPNEEAEKHKGPPCYQLASAELGFLQLLSLEVQLVGNGGGLKVFFNAYSDVRGETMIRGRGKERWWLQLCPPFHQSDRFRLQSAEEERISLCDWDNSQRKYAHCTVS